MSPLTLEAQSKPIIAISLFLLRWETSFAQAPQLFGDGESGTPQQGTVVGPSSYSWRWMKHKKPSTTKYTSSVLAERIRWD